MSTQQRADCPFCGILNGNEPGKIIARDDEQPRKGLGRHPVDAPPCDSECLRDDVVALVVLRVAARVAPHPRGVGRKGSLEPVALGVVGVHTG